VGGTAGWGAGFVWNQTASTYWPAGATTLATLASVDAVSQNGKYAVGQDTGFANGVLYTASGSGAGSYSTIAPGWAYSVNNLGWVGGDTDAAAGFAGTGWLWDGTTLHNLDTEMRAIGAVPTDYTVCGVWGINNSNQVLVWEKYAGNYSVVESYLLTPAMAGDANKDGTVNINDLSKVLTNYDKTGLHWADGDFDGNGTVDINDLSKVLTNYDKTQGAAGAAGIMAVPEPSSLLLLATAAAAGLLAYGRGRRK
jgi:hypothetical protein